MKHRLAGLHPTVLVLASTHFLVDSFGNVLAPLLPLLITNLRLSLAAAGTLQMCFQLSSSVAQLGFGYIADRWRPRLLLVIGPLVSVSLLTLVGLAPTPLTLALVLIAGGLGGAAFHPPAAALVHRFSGRQRGLAMSFHITSGSVGQAMAPLVFAPFVQAFGLRAMPILMVPALALLSLVLLRRIPPIERLAEKPESGGLAGLWPYARPLGLLYAVVVLRTLAAMSFATFIPVLLTRRGMSLAGAGTAVSVYLVAVGLGGFFGGPAADRFGPRRVIILSLLASVPFLALVPLLEGWRLVAALACGGFLLQSTLPVNVTFAQHIAPISAATVSSLMMGFAWGTGGLSVPLVGMVADRVGIESALVVMSATPLAAALLAVPLPSGTQGRDHPLPAPVDGLGPPASDVAARARFGTD